MIEMTWIPELIRNIAWIYIGLWAFLTIGALMLPRTLSSKAGATLLVTAVFGAFPAYMSFTAKKHEDEQRPIVEKEQAQLKAAMARFEERCKTAGEKIYRTVEGVEGVLLTHVRANRKPGDRSDPNWPDAALPDESPGDEYLLTFLYWEHHEDKRSMRGYLNYTPSSLPGYKFVDIKSEGSTFQRIRLERPESTKLISTPLSGRPARYSISIQNFVDPEDRKFWVAGTKVTITDTITSALLAEKTWYSVEPGQGSTAGFRSPWGFAKTCPFHLGWSGGSTRFFVDQVLKPKRGE